MISWIKRNIKNDDTEKTVNKKDFFNLTPEQCCQLAQPALLSSLTELSLLIGVPFDYIVPNENYLPRESIRFFSVDKKWISALLEGASSIGRNTSLEASFLNTATLPLFNTTLRPSLYKRRQSLMHANHKSNVTEPANIGNNISGFLMRSALVEHFKGIEVKGFENKKPLTMLRLDKIADQVLLCIFEGQVDSVEFIEPSESLHFGPRNKQKKLQARSIQDNEVGKLVGAEITMPINDDRVVDVANLAQAFLKAVVKAGQPFTSAEFALQMISVAGRGRFDKEGVK